MESTGRRSSAEDPICGACCSAIQSMWPSRSQVSIMESLERHEMRDTLQILQDSGAMIEFLWKRTTWCLKKSLRRHCVTLGYQVIMWLEFYIDIYTLSDSMNHKVKLVQQVECFIQIIAEQVQRSQAITERGDSECHIIYFISYIIFMALRRFLVANRENR